MKGRSYIMRMEGKYFNQVGESSSQQTRQEGIISKEVKPSSPTRQSQDFVRLEREETHKELRSDHMSEAEPSQSIVASQEQRVHEVGLVDHSQESHDQLLRKKLDASIANHYKNFKNFIDNFQEIKKRSRTCWIGKGFFHI